MSVDAPTIVDPPSGLFSEAFLRASLPTRVATARRAMKQLGLVMIDVTDADGNQATDTSAIGATIRDTLRDSDTGVLLTEGRYALLLEFTPVEGCVIISRRLADRLAAADPALVATVGVASYPVHAIDASELLAASERALREALDTEVGSLGVAPVAD